MALYKLYYLLTYDDIWSQDQGLLYYITYLQTDRKTDGQTDRRTTYDSNTALCTREALKCAFLYEIKYTKKRFLRVRDCGCSLSPFEFQETCAFLVIKRASRIDAFIVGSLIPIHRLICGPNKAGMIQRPYSRLRPTFSLEIITRLFSYRPNIKPSVDNCPRIRLGKLSTPGLDVRSFFKWYALYKFRFYLLTYLLTGPIWKQLCDNLFIELTYSATNQLLYLP